MRPQLYSDERIFESISEVLAQHGYEALTLGNIAEQANLSPAILSKRFGSKRGMFIAYYEYLVTITEKAFDSLSACAMPLMESLTRVFTGWHDVLKTPQACANFMILYLKLDIEPELIELSKKRHRVIDEKVQAILDASVRLGELRCQSIAEMSRVLQAAATGAIMLWCRNDAEIEPMELIATCIRMVIETNGGGLAK